MIIANEVVPDIICDNIFIHGYLKEMKVDEEGSTPGIDTYTIVLKGLFRVGRFVTAKEVFNKMEAGGMEPNFHTHFVMVDGFCKKGNVDEALQLLET